MKRDETNIAMRESLASKGYIEHNDGSFTTPSGKHYSKEKIDQLTKDAKTDTRPASRADVARNGETILTAVGNVLKDERRLFDAKLKALDDRLADLDGKEVLHSGARIVIDQNCRAIRKALAPLMERNAVILEKGGDLPDWLYSEVFS